VQVLAFATASEALGAAEEEVTLPAGSSVHDLRLILSTRYPALEVLWPRLAVAVDGELVSADALLVDGAEVALLPPVSGGREESLASLVDGPIDVEALTDAVAHPSCGAVLLFLGNVRDHHEGRAVELLTYHAYRPMAETILRRLVSELEAAAPGVRVGILHRLGEVPVGEASVAIAVASPHRKVAYETSRQALERLKHEVPIWKRELYADGELAWREEESLV